MKPTLHGHAQGAKSSSAFASLPLDGCEYIEDVAEKLSRDLLQKALEHPTKRQISVLSLICNSCTMSPSFCLYVCVKLHRHYNVQVTVLLDLC